MPTTDPTRFLHLRFRETTTGDTHVSHRTTTFLSLTRTPLERGDRAIRVTQEVWDSPLIYLVIARYMTRSNDRYADISHGRWEVLLATVDPGVATEFAWDVELDPGKPGYPWNHRDDFEGVEVHSFRVGARMSIIHHG